MEFTIDLKSWKVVTDDGQRKIAGEFVVKAGAMEVASKSFNEGYGYAKIVFPTELQLEAEKLTEKIAAVIMKTYTGKEG